MGYRIGPNDVAKPAVSNAANETVRNAHLDLRLQGSGGFYRYSAEAAPMQTLAPWRVDFSQSGQLYNLSSDPYEQTNLYDQHPETVQRLTKKMRAAIVDGRSQGN